MTGARAGSDADAVVALIRDQNAQLVSIGERLAVSALRFCPMRGYAAGLQVQTLGQYGADFRPAAARVLGIGALPTISVVVPDGAAAAAGLAVGDQLVWADGRRFSEATPAGAAATYQATRAAQALLDDALADGVATLAVRASGRERKVDVIARAACPSRFELRAGAQQSANANGTTVQVTSGLVGAAQGEGQVAAVIAHELAHNILRHPQRRRSGGERPRVRDTEVAADRLSVYLLDAAGYAPTDAAAFWRTWGRRRDLGIFADRSHPGWRERAAIIEAEAAAIAAQRAAGRPVVAPPDLQP